MSLCQGVLDRADSGRHYAEPFPWLVIEEALPLPLYEELAASFPSLDDFRSALKEGRRLLPEHREFGLWLRRLRRSNARANIPYAVARELGSPPVVWRTFLERHTGEAFFSDVRHVFGSHLEQALPGVPLDGLRVGGRWIDRDADIALDALLAINTPAKKPSAVTRAHTDNADKLFAGMLYFGDPLDEGGGDLIIYKRTQPPSAEDTKWPRAESLQEAYRVPYRANTLVLLLNSAWSVHGVSIRSTTPYPRRFVNFVGEFDRPLF